MNILSLRATVPYCASSWQLDTHAQPPDDSPPSHYSESSPTLYSGSITSSITWPRQWPSASSSDHVKCKNPKDFCYTLSGVRQNAIVVALASCTTPTVVLIRDSCLNEPDVASAQLYAVSCPEKKSAAVVLLHGKNRCLTRGAYPALFKHTRRVEIR